VVTVSILSVGGVGRFHSAARARSGRPHISDGRVSVPAERSVCEDRQGPLSGCATERSTGGTRLEAGCCTVCRMRDLSQTITIRSTLESDWPQIRELRIENATDNPISYGATLRTTQRMDEDAWRLRGRRGEGPDTACLAAVDTTTGRWVGMMSGQSGDDDGPQAVLTGVYVSPDYRGRQCGVADALLDEVEDWACRTSDLLRCYVYENSTRAIGFYRRRDFRETGRRRAITLEPDGHTLEMVKTLRVRDQSPWLSKVDRRSRP